MPPSSRRSRSRGRRGGYFIRWGDVYDEVFIRWGDISGKTHEETSPKPAQPAESQPPPQAAPAARPPPAQARTPEAVGEAARIETPPLVPSPEEVKRKLELFVVKLIPSLREKHGDIMRMDEFFVTVANAYEREHGSGDLALEYIEDVLKKLSEKKLLTFDPSVQIVRLSPEGFGRDELKVLKVVSTRTPPQISVEELAVETGWPVVKAKTILETLEKIGLARRIPGSYTGGQDIWFFPGLERKLS